MSSPPTRREVLKSVAATGATMVVAPTVAAEPSTAPAASQPTPAASQPSDVTIADLAAADRVAGRTAYSDAEHAMMLAGVRERRGTLVRLREQSDELHGVAVPLAFVPLAPIPSGDSVCTISDAPLLSVELDHLDKLAFASAADLSRLIHAKAISSAQLTRMYLDRLKTIGPKLNCVITVTENIALRQAALADEEIAAGKDRGPLHGLPYGLKDFISTKDAPTTWGVELYRDRVIDEDATLYEKLSAAGAVLLGKLSLGELCMGDVWFGGTTRTPWDLSQGSSGSSAGPCAAVAAGLCAFAIGSETLGSIVSPCVVNGTTGLRPTFGRISRAGCMSLSYTMDKLGPITRSVEDAALIFAAIHGRDLRDVSSVDAPFAWNPRTFDPKRLRVGYDPAAWDFESDDAKKHPELTATYRAAFASVRDLAGEFRPIKLPPAKEYEGVASLTIAVESAAEFTDLLTSGDVRTLKQQAAWNWPNSFRVGSTIPASDYLLAMKKRAQLQQAMAEAMKGIDLYISRPFVGPTLAFTNLTGHPSVVTRCGIHEGRPKMIEFIGQPYRDDELLGLAFAYERKHAWTNHHPDTDALR